MSDDDARPTDAQLSEALVSGSDSGVAVEYDCSPWAGETRRILKAVVVEREIPHVWEGTVLVVPGDLEDVVDDIVERVALTAKPSLGTARSTVAYDVSPWAAAAQNRLVDSLVGNSIPHEWDAEGDLVIHEEDAEATEALIAELGDPDGAGELDGLELNDRLGQLFVVVDRLTGDPFDSKGTRDLGPTYEGIENVAVPFGIEAELWLQLHRLATALIVAVNRVGSGSGEAHEFDDESTLADGGSVPPAVAGDGALSGLGSGGSVSREGGEGADRERELPESVQGLARSLRDLLRRFV